MKNIMSVSPSVSIRTFFGNEDRLLIEKIIALRVESWQRSMDDYTTDIRHLVSDPLEYDAQCIHFAAFEKDVLIGAARLTPIYKDKDLQAMMFYNSLKEAKLPFYLFNRLVVQPEIRHQGVASALTKARLDFLKNCVKTDSYTLIRDECCDYYCREFGFKPFLRNIAHTKNNKLPYPNSTILKLIID